MHAKNVHLLLCGTLTINISRPWTGGGRTGGKIVLDVQIYSDETGPVIRKRDQTLAGQGPGCQKSMTCTYVDLRLFIWEHIHVKTGTKNTCKLEFKLNYSSFCSETNKFGIPRSLVKYVF
jgi:hypothetical protein